MYCFCPSSPLLPELQYAYVDIFAVCLICIVFVMFRAFFQTDVALGFNMDIFFWFIFHLWILFLSESNLLINSSIKFLISVNVFFTSEIIISFYFYVFYSSVKILICFVKISWRTKSSPVSVDLFPLFITSLAFLPCYIVSLCDWLIFIECGTLHLKEHKDDFKLWMLLSSTRETYICF